MMVIDPITGKKARFASKKTIIESYKIKDFEKMNNFNFDIDNRLKNNSIMKFY